MSVAEEGRLLLSDDDYVLNDAANQRFATPAELGGSGGPIRIADVLQASLTPEVDKDYAFAGRHFVASYTHCDVAKLVDHAGLRRAMEDAVRASGAQILDSCEYPFPEGGNTMVFLLSESHASVHTYPEFGACFVDLFTCGHTCSAERFDAVLRAYLRPSHVNVRMLLRGQHISDDTFLP